MFQAVAFLTDSERSRRIGFLEASERLTIDEHAELSVLRSVPAFVAYVNRSDAELSEALDYWGFQTTALSSATRFMVKKSLAAVRAFRARKIGPKDCTAQRITARTYLGSLAAARAQLGEIEAEIAQRQSFAAIAA